MFNKVASVAGYCLAEQPHHRPSMSTVLTDLEIAFLFGRHDINIQQQHLMKQQYSRSRRRASTKRGRPAPTPSACSVKADVQPPGSVEKRAPDPRSPNSDSSRLARLRRLDGRIVILIFSFSLFVFFKTVSTPPSVPFKLSHFVLTNLERFSTFFVDTGFKMDF